MIPCNSGKGETLVFVFLFKGADILFSHNSINQNKMEKKNDASKIIDKMSVTPQKSPFSVVTEFRRTDVIVGGKMKIDKDQALALLILTSIKGLTEVQTQDEWDSERLIQGDKCRQILRAFAKEVLYGGNTPVSETDLLTLFATDK
jgi:hypothetical protein